MIEKVWRPSLYSDVWYELRTLDFICILTVTIKLNFIFPWHANALYNDRQSNASKNIKKKHYMLP